MKLERDLSAERASGPHGSRRTEPGPSRSRWRGRALLARALLWVWRFREESLWRAVAGEIPAGAIVTRRYAGSRLALELGRSSAHWRLWCRGERSVPESRVLRARVRPGGRVIDVGANIGYTALTLSNLVGNGGRVVCYEPDLENLRELRRNVADNRLANVSIVEAAVGQQAGVARLKGGLNATVAEDGEREILMVALDAMATEAVDLVKIDVEGYEGEVLEGASELVQRRRPELFVEIHPRLARGWSHRRILDWIRSRYSRVDAYEVRTNEDLPAKLESRYLNRDPLVPVDPDRLVEECTGGRRRSVFWLLATEGR